MTVLNDNPPFIEYIGDGVTTFFAYTFEVKSYSTISVLVDEVAVPFTRGDTGVTITPAPADGAVIKISRSHSLDQLTDWSPQEAFPGAKTEDAQDKLIMLKQEQGFNQALMNLQSQPFLDNVTLVNDVGTNAVIPIWNVLTGVFSGEVNTVIPNAGDVVAKPENFVYMQYGDEEIQVLTTTLYPLEAAEALQMNIALDDAELQPIPNDVIAQDGVFVGAVMEEILISTGPFDDVIDQNGVFVGAEMVQVLISTGPFDDAIDQDGQFLGAIMEDKLVKVYAPDEALQLSIALDESACSLTPI